MARFIKTLALFVLPLAVVFSFPVVVFIKSGELYSLPEVEHLANTTPVLFGAAYSNFLQEYKFEMTQMRRPQVLALGSSRVGAFNSRFFKHPETFYNATGDVLAFSDFQNYVDGLSQKPSIIIVGMDQYFFNPARPIDDILERPNPFTTHVSAQDIVIEGMFGQGGWWRVYSDYAQGKFTLGELFAPRHMSTIGLRAYAGDGHVNDGSHYPGNIDTDPQAEQHITDTIAALVASINDTDGAEYGPSITPHALVQLRALLHDCQEKGIVVVGFLPPFAHAAYQALLAHPNAPYAKTFKTLPGVLASIYREYGFGFYDYSDPAFVSGSDKEMVESKHGSEKLYARIVLDMARRSGVIAPLVDAPMLQKQLKAATSSYMLYSLQ
ncbi:MAG: hypothetical protein V4474_02865 [Patescibacteria group bacterium]